MRGRDLRSKMDYSPGPGQYSYNSLSKSPAFTFKSRYPEGKKDDVPGPGQYSTEKPRSSPSYSMKGFKYIQKHEYIPGPGQYNPKDPGSSPAYSMRKKLFQGQSENFPGPGQYNHADSFSKAEQFIHSYTQLRAETSSKNTHSYFIDSVVINDKSPKWTIPKAKKSEKQPSLVPGPGMYDLGSTIGNLPSYAVKTFK
jgi:hypothetical protein